MSRCRSCDAEIIWAVWKVSGKRTPFDAVPVPEGNVILAPGDPPIATLVRNADGLPLFLSHFVTCPDARSWRRRER